MYKLNFTDQENWLKIVKEEVKDCYIIPDFLEKNTCLELGVNVGAFALVNYKRFDKIVGLEASISNFLTANKNIESAGITNVKYFNLAASDESNKTLRLRALMQRINGSNVEGSARSGDCTVLNIKNEDLDIIGFNHGISEEFEEVKSINFKDSFNLLSSKRVNYLKCDIEGAEYAFLIANDLSYVDFISMELHYTYLGVEKVRDLMVHLNKYFEFYDGSTINDFIYSWPPPAIVDLVNRNLLTPKLKFFIFFKRIAKKYRKWKIL